MFSTIRRFFVPGAALVVALAAPALAVVPAKSGSELASKVFTDPALSPQPWSQSLARLTPAQIGNHPAWQSYVARTPGTVAHIDLSSGNPSVIEGRLEEWIPGRGNSLTMADLGMSGGGPLGKPTLEQVESLAQSFLSRNRSILDIDPRYLRLNEQNSGPSPDGKLWRVYYSFVVDDVPVESAMVGFIVNSGNLIQVVTQHAGNLAGVNTRPFLDSQQALDLLESYVGGLRPGDRAGKAALSLVPVSSDRGRPGLAYRLVYRTSLQRAGESESWEMTVDAVTGELLSFVDRNRYAVVNGGVWPVSWRINDVPQLQVTRPMPFVQTSRCGVTDLSGVFAYCGDATNQVLFNGKYVSTVDTLCGAFVENDDASNNFLLGDNLADVAPGDCYVPPGKSVGNTAAAREQYYHVNLIKEKGRKYYPANNWLKGNLTANVNLDNTCNAFWNGSTINFYRSGGGCGNTGEEIAVSLHEWGHGFDDNDGFPSADQGTGEAMGDTMAMTQSHDSCIGWGFNLSTTAVCGGYGNACTICDGVRDVDYGRHVNNGNNAPHAVRDTWKGIAGSGIRDGSGFECANNASYQGPCGTEGHCESYPMSTANWDLPNRDLPEQIEPAGPPYSTATMAQAWDIWDRFWWESRLDALSGYQCPGDNENLADGCSAGTYYSIYRAVDDADGNLANGTPHAASIFRALDRHSIACGAAGDPANQNNSDGCPPLAAPTGLTVTGGSNAVLVSWNAVANATEYRVLRNELSCNAGFSERAVVTGTSYTDLDAANGVTYYYQIIALANNRACVGPPSSCVSGTPVVGASVAMVSGSEIVTADTGDSDLHPDNCETVTARITLINDGNVTVTNPRLLGVTSSNPSVTITSTFPIVAAPTLAVGATATVSFQFAVGLATPAALYETLNFTASVGCDACLVPGEGSFTFEAEEDDASFIGATPKLWSFPGNFDGWKPAEGSLWILSSDRPKGAAGDLAVHATPSQQACTINPGAGNGACDSLLSPVIELLGAGPWTVTVPNWFTTEEVSGSQHWDRGNVHIVNTGTGTHTLATISGGRAYAAGSNDDAGLCHINLQLGWAECTGNSWQNSTINLGAMGFVAGNRLRLELNYNSDGVASGEGIYFDDVTATNVRTIVPDVQGNVCVCNPPSGLTNNTATDAGGSCADTGVTVSWTQNPADWQDGGAGTRSYRVLRNGVLLASGGCSGTIAYGTTTCNDNTGTNGTSYTYSVRYVNGCNQSSDTAGASASDVDNTPVPTISGGTANVCPATTVALSTESGGGRSNYQWYIGASPIGGATTANYTATASGTYTVSYMQNGCTGTSAGHTVTISPCAPNVVYDGNSLLTQVCGDGDAIVEPGEQWSVTVTLRNTGNVAATTTAASLTLNAGSVVSATITGNPGAYGTINPAATASDTFVFTVSASAVCVNNITFDVTAISSAEGSYPSQIPAFTVQVGQSSTENATQQTSPLNATSGSATSNFTPAFTLTSATSATVAFTAGHINAPAALAPSADTRLDEVVPGANYGTDATMRVGRIGNNSTDQFSLLQFNVSAIPPTATVTAATLQLTATLRNGNNNADNRTHNVHRANVAWTELGANYTNMNANFDAAVSGSIATGTVAGVKTSTSIAALVQGWVTTPASNLGMMLRDGTGTNSSDWTYATRDSGTVADRPVLNVSYTVPGGTTTANVQVELIDPSLTATVLKAFGAATASPYNVTALYTGAGTYQLRVTENAGGVATITAGTMSATRTQCNVAACGATPGLITGETWGGTKDTWSWATDANSTGYRVYRGTQADLPNLLNGGLDACERWSGAPITTGPILTEDPSALPGRFYWYITIGTNGATNGPAGNATAGPRIVNSTGICP